MVDEDFLHKVIDYHVGDNKNTFDEGMLAYILNHHGLELMSPIKKIQKVLDEEFNRIGYKVHIGYERGRFPDEHNFHVTFIPGDPNYIQDMPAGILDL